MRSMIMIVLFSFLLALGLGIFCSLYTQHIATDYQRQIESTAEAIREAQWAEAREKTAALEKTWENHARILSILTNHTQVDTVGLALCQLRISVEAEEPYYALLHAAEFREALILIQSRDAFVLKNIL